MRKRKLWWRISRWGWRRWRRLWRSKGIGIIIRGNFSMEGRMIKFYNSTRNSSMKSKGNCRISISLGLIRGILVVVCNNQNRHSFWMINIWILNWILRERSIKKKICLDLSSNNKSKWKNHNNFNKNSKESTNPI